MSGPLLSVAEEVHGAAWDVGLVVAAVVVNIGVPDEGVVAERARTNLDLRELMVSMEAACKSLAARPPGLRGGMVLKLVTRRRKSVGRRVQREVRGGESIHQGQ